MGDSDKIAPQLKNKVAKADSGDRIRALLMLDNPTHLDGSRKNILGKLKRNAKGSQNHLEMALEKHAQTAGDVRVVNRFWITNMVLVEFTASHQRLQTMAALPGVRRVIPNFTLTAPEPDASTSTTAVDGEVTWGLDKIDAERVWDELGVDGSGVRVATLDTGVDISHPDLAGKMATDNPADPNYPGGWMEFNSSGGLVRSQPHDSAYHGTHVSGTIHGGHDSGVAIGGAYGAELMHGLVIPGGGGSFAQVAAGMQWTVAPVDADGNPAGEPADVVNMSLGGNGFHDEMIAPTRAMRAAGTFPAFAIGNNCGSLGTASPGNVYDAVGVGATDDADNIASFSCGGVVQKSSWDNPPAEWPDSYVKPNISAPGVDVWSASPGGGYRYLSGTSMATPHTAATVALMRSAAPELTVEQILDTLSDTAFWDNRYAPAPPDTRFGMGRINAFEATRVVAIKSGVTGTVTDADTGDPVADATVTVTPGDIEIKTGSDGEYTARAEPGTYTVKTSAFGYDTATSEGVQVTADTFTTVNTALQPGPRGDISGTVSFAESGHGIPGVAVSVQGTPVEFSAETGTDGTYTISNVPVGEYQVAAEHPTFTAPAPVTVTVTEGGTATADHAFGPPPRSVALVGRYMEQYQDVVFEPRGIDSVVYSYDELLDAAQHSTVILGYGLSSEYDQATFQSFLNATDASGAGVIFTHHAFGSANGIKQLSLHTGQPVSVGQSSGGSGSAESYYEITANHPILEGFAPGDHIVIDNSTQAKWAGWFDGYSGEGRQTIASMGRTLDGVLGGGIGVDQRANSRHVLLSTHGVSSTRGPDEWTPEATQLFLNAINWASPPPVANQPYFALHHLQLGTDVVKVNQSVTIEASIKNVGASGGDYDAALLVDDEIADTKSVNLDAGESTTVTWSISRDQLGVYDVRVAYLESSFRVRAPIVDLAANRVKDSDGATPPLADAVVELIDDGAVAPIGRTDSDGEISFEIPDAIGEYTLVVRRDRADSDSEAYLLHQVITVIDDKGVTLSPRVLSGSKDTPETGDDLSTRVDLDLDTVNQDHTGWAYLRPSATAPYGYGFTPGDLIASVDTYQAVTVNRV
ncbi:MAG: S8 family serine peptidase, partial [Micromonosporaceae bacterium]